MSWTGIYAMKDGVPFSFSSEYARENWIKKTGGTAHDERLPSTSISPERWKLIYQDGGFWMGQRIFKEIPWGKFLAWTRDKDLVKETSLGETVTLLFADGSIAVLQSNYDGPYSDITPGNGIEPPSVQVSP